MTETPTTIALDKIHVDDHSNYRTSMDKKKIAGLAATFKTVYDISGGAQWLLAPLGLAPLPGDHEALKDGKTHKLIYGFRRFSAIQLLAEQDVKWIQEVPFQLARAPEDEVEDGAPVSEEDRAILSQAQRVLQIIENEQREAPSALDTARAIQQLRDDGHAVRDIGNMLGKSGTWVSQRTGLLKLPDEVQKALDQGKILFSHARALQRLKAHPALMVKALKLHLRKTKETSVKDMDGNDPEVWSLSHLDSVISSVLAKLARAQAKEEEATEEAPAETAAESEEAQTKSAKSAAQDKLIEDAEKEVTESRGDATPPVDTSSGESPKLLATEVPSTHSAVAAEELAALSKTLESDIKASLKMMADSKEYEDKQRELLCAAYLEGMKALTDHIHANPTSDLRKLHPDELVDKFVELVEANEAYQLEAPAKKAPTGKTAAQAKARAAAAQKKAAQAAAK